MKMSEIRFGIEIETVGQTRATVAEAIRSVVGGRVEHVGTPFCYDPWHVIDDQGGTWKVVADSSLSAVKRLQAEIVSPILNYADLKTVQKIVRAVRRAGAKVNESCGIHIHLDAEPFDGRTLCNLAKIVYKQESIILKALKVQQARIANYAAPVEGRFIRRIEDKRPASKEELNPLWYGFTNENPEHYDISRYHGLNLHNVWYRGTVEFRWFEGTLHAGKVKSYIQLALAIGAKALNAKSARSKKRDFNPESAKYDFRVFLLGLGLVGKEFKTARLHLLAALPGDAAFKNGRR